MLGKPPPSSLVTDPMREPPRLAPHTIVSFMMAADVRVQEAISIFLGFGRRIPPEFIHAGDALRLYRETRDKEPAEVAKDYYDASGIHGKAMLRAAWSNIQKLRRASPWEA